MIKLERTSVMNLENAIRGMRNPLNSWDKSDSCICDNFNSLDVCEKCSHYDDACPDYSFIIGKNDLNLAKRLCKAGTDHRKFLRQIFVSVDITAPLYWYKEYDVYKVGTTSNSCSTMHTVHKREFTLEDFSTDHMSGMAVNFMREVVKELNAMRLAFNETKDKESWYSMIQLLPSSYNQMRTCTMTYENLRNMYHARKNHKLQEWHTFCDWIKTLPYAEELIIGEDN